MKKFLTILFLIAFGSFAVAEDTDKTSKMQTSVKKVSEKVEKAKNTARSKVKESKKQLTVVQQGKLAKKQASKRNKLLKKKQKSEEFIKIQTKHLEYKQKQLEEFSEKKVNEVIDNKETKEQETKQ